MQCETCLHFRDVGMDTRAHTRFARALIPISVVKAKTGRRVQQCCSWIAVRNALLNPVEAAMKLDQ